jgi:gliding motility-associated-like protein
MKHLHKRNIFILLSLWTVFIQKGMGQIASDTLGCVPLLVQFTSPIDTLSNVIWDFKDGASSDRKNASHVFIQPGVFQVTLSNYGQVVATKTITVYARPDIAIAADIYEGCAPLTVNFQNNTTVPTGVRIEGYLWDFGDGDGSSAVSPAHQYNTVDHFNITVNLSTNVENCNITRTFNKFININSALNTGFIIDSIAPLCTYPSYMYLRNIGEKNPSFTYKWKLGNGTTSSEMQPAPVKIDKDSLYSISLEVNNNKGCIARVGSQADVTFFPKLAFIYQDTTCAAKQTQILTQSNATVFRWNFGTAANPEFSNVKNPEVTFNENGRYDVAVYYESKEGCKHDTMFTVNVLKKDADFTMSPEIICSLPAQIVCKAKAENYGSYEWNEIQGGPTHTFTIPYKKRDRFYQNKEEEVPVRLKVFHEGCEADTTIYYKYILPNAQFTISDHEGIIPFTVHIQDVSQSVLPIIRWIIDWGDGTIIEYDKETILTAHHEYTEQGNYYINMSLFTEGGCEDLYFGALFTAHDPTPGNIKCNCKCSAMDGILCYKQPLNIFMDNQPSQIDALHFNLGPTIGNCDQQFYMTGAVMYNDPGKYQLTATLENGGEFTEVEGLEIQVLGPRAVMDYNVNCDGSYSVYFSHKSKDYTSVKWLIEGKEMTEHHFSYIFPGRGDYPVSLIAYNDTHSCNPDTVHTLIRLRDVRAKIETKPEWCFNVEQELIASGSVDEVSGCKMGYTWSFPVTDKPNIISDRDTITTLMPPGMQRIVLTVRDVNGCEAKDSVEITSYFIHAGFFADADRICTPLEVLFTDTSAHDLPIERYQWSFNDQVNQPVVSHTFTKIDSLFLNISLTIVDTKGCKSTASQLFQTYNPRAEIFVPSVVCEGVQATFLATEMTDNRSLLEYKWVVDNIEICNSDRCTTPGFSPGNHTGSLLITEVSTRCNQSYDISFYATKRPQAVISALDDSVFCYPKTLQLFGDKSITDSKDRVSYRWSYSNGRSSTKTNTLETFGKGSYNIKLTVRSIYQCESTADINVKLIGPEGAFVADKDRICKGETIKYTLVNPKEVKHYFWDFGQGEVDNNKSPVAFTYNYFPPSGKTFASLVLYGHEKNCRVIQSMPVDFYKVHASFVPDTVCGSTMRIINKTIGARKATWNWAGKTTQNLDSVIVIQSQQYGSFPLKLSIEGLEGNCKDSMSAHVTFREPAILKLPPSIAPCEGDTVALAYNPTYRYEFSPAEYAVISGNQIHLIPGGGKDLEITATSVDGCTSNHKIKIGSRNISNKEFKKTVYTCEDLWQDKIMVDSSAETTITWGIPGLAATDWLSCTNCRNPRLQQPYAGLIYATVYDRNTCVIKDYQFNIINPEVKIPNVFSPNGDGENDLFRPVALQTDISEMFQLEEFRIYNRWGKEIYNEPLAWDGITEGRPATADVYYYNIVYSIGESCLIKVKGDVTLMR